MSLKGFKTVYSIRGVLSKPRDQISAYILSPIAAFQSQSFVTHSDGLHKILPITFQQTRTAISVQQPILDSTVNEDIRSKARPPSEIPGPKRWPIVGSFLDMKKREGYAPDMLHKVWYDYFDTYGPIYRLDIPNQRPAVFIYRPEHIKAISHLDEPPKLTFEVLTRIRNDYPECYVKDETGIMAEGGKEWWRVRKRVQQPTLKMKTVAHYLPKMDKINLQFIEKMEDRLDEKNELPEDFIDHLYNWSIENISLITFGRSVGGLEMSQEGREMVQNIHAMMDGLKKTVFEPSYLKNFKTKAYKDFANAHQKIFSYVKEGMERSIETLEEKVNNGDDLDLSHQLLLIPDLKITDIQTYMMDLLLAAIDNAVPTVGFTLLNLARHPEKQAKVHEELDRVLGKDTNTITSQQMAQLSYTKAALKETLRLYPSPVSAPRTLDKDVVIGGYRIPKGFDVFPFMRRSHMSEENFLRAKEYLPERFLKDRSLGPIKPYTYYPFGYGLRVCIGRRIAEQEMNSLVARILQKYHLEWNYGDVDMKMRFLLYPDKPLKMTMNKRF